MRLPDTVAARPIADARLIENKRGKGGNPSVMYAQGDWIVERTLDGSVCTAQLTLNPVDVIGQA